MAETTSDARDEVRLPPGELGAPPAPLVALTRATHRGAPLVPVVELDTARREWVLADSDGHPLATVTDDRVTSQTLAAPTMVTRWAEIEVELAEHSTVEVLDRVEQALLAELRWLRLAGARRAGARRAGGGRIRPRLGESAAACTEAHRVTAEYRSRRAQRSGLGRPQSAAA